MNHNILNEFMSTLCTNDSHELFKHYSNLEDYLKSVNKNLNCIDLIKFCEATLLFVKSDRAKHEIQGLIVIQLFIQRLADAMNIHLVEILEHLIDHYIGHDDQINASAKKILFFMMKIYSPKFVWNKLAYGFEQEKKEQVKEFLLDLLRDTFEEYGFSSFNRDEIENCLINLKNDSNSISLNEKSAKLLRHFNDQSDLEKIVNLELKEKTLKLKIEIKELKNSLLKLQHENESYKILIAASNADNDNEIENENDNDNENDNENKNDVIVFDNENNINMNATSSHHTNKKNKRQKDEEISFYDENLLNEDSLLCDEDTYDRDYRINFQLNNNMVEENHDNDDNNNNKQTFYYNINNNDNEDDSISTEYDWHYTESSSLNRNDENLGENGDISFMSSNNSDNLLLDYENNFVDDVNMNQKIKKTKKLRVGKANSNKIVIKASEYVPLIEETIDCKDCTNNEEYSLLFRNKLNELLGSKWSRTKDQLTKDQSHLKYYYVCNKYYQTALKCKSKCIVDINLATKMATILHNSQTHNHI